jgi:EamA domain-containing membrane protein RarD
METWEIWNVRILWSFPNAIIIHATLQRWWWQERPPCFSAQKASAFFRFSCILVLEQHIEDKYIPLFRPLVHKPSNSPVIIKFSIYSVEYRQLLAFVWRKGKNPFLFSLLKKKKKKRENLFLQNPNNVFLRSEP